MTKKNGTLPLSTGHQAPPPENCDHLLQLLDNLPANSILVGDFNYPYIDWGSLTSLARGRNFLNKCGTCSFEQLIDFPTHIKGNILDLVLTNNPEKILNIQPVGRLGKSDHESLLIELAAAKNPTQRADPKPV